MSVFRLCRVVVQISLMLLCGWRWAATTSISRRAFPAVSGVGSVVLIEASVPRAAMPLLSIGMISPTVCPMSPSALRPKVLTRWSWRTPWSLMMA